MDIILYNIIAAILCLILGYLFGSFPTAIVIGKVFYHQDPRDFGSKNAGGTNAGRLWGKKVGFIVIVIDMIKTIIPIWICWAILTFVPFGDKPLMATTLNRFAGLDGDYVIRWSVYWLASLGTVIGHCYPIFANFRGGKGVSSTMGVIATSSWLIGFIPGLIIYLLILKIKKYVSLASIVTPFIMGTIYLTWSILCLTGVVRGFETLPCYGPTIAVDWFGSLVIFILAFFVLFKHSSNIERLKNGTERKIKWMK